MLAIFGRDEEILSFKLHWWRSVCKLMSMGESRLPPTCHFTQRLFLCCQGSCQVPVLVRQDIGWGQLGGQFRTKFSASSKLYGFKPEPWRLVFPSAALLSNTFALGSFSWRIETNSQVTGEGSGSQKAVVMTNYPSGFDTLFTPNVERFGHPHKSVLLRRKAVLLGERSGKQISVRMPHRGHS